jgi:squalene-associated FAD-dependent desaturase
MASVLVAGGGLAGLATAAALGDAGFEVDLFEARPFLGGRATSYAPPGATGEADLIDNCQHVLLRCCVNLLNLYARLGVADEIAFYREFFFIEPGGRVSTLKAGGLPAPLHFTSSFLRLSCLSVSEKLALARGLLALRRERTRRRDLDQITMLDWLREHDQPPRVIKRFWEQILVSAINEDVDRMAAIHAFQVFWLGFLARSDGYEMGVPAVPLQKLYTSREWDRWPHVRIHLRTPVDQLRPDGAQVGNELRKADYYVCALPFEKVAQIAPDLSPPAFEHSPITGIHLWFDRSVTDLPHATLLDRTIQWLFNKDAGRYVQLVVSASRSLSDMPRNDVIALAVDELTEFLPAVAAARIERAHVVKEIRATFSARPGLEELRPPAQTRFANVFVAGDWTRSGWPATMEGAVRSGYLAADAICKAAGRPDHFLLPDIG